MKGVFIANQKGLFVDDIKDFCLTDEVKKFYSRAEWRLNKPAKGCPNRRHEMHLNRRPERRLNKRHERRLNRRHERRLNR